MIRLNEREGFTIVELLVVIVVIGILAAITIVAYSGISNRAKVSALQSDLSNGSNQLKLFQVDNSNYPATISTNCVTQSDTTTNKCIKASSGNTYSDYQTDNTSNPQSFCLTSTNSSGVSYRTTDNSTPTIGNCSRTSCLAILNASESTGSGIYWIKSAGTYLRVYCDMVTSGGGWTLILTNPGPYTTWNLTNVYSFNSNNPSILSLYSILNRADSIKTNISGNLQYRIDAGSIGHWGGVWQAPFTNTFVGTSVVNNSTNIQKYDTWAIDTTLDDTSSLTNVMPWVGNSTKILSTWGNSGSWWGTLVSGGGYSPAPYMSSENPNPGIIWYWVK